ncbi:hypothetical protein GALMADRAFT_143983 [Galerina marginata CBS 339.88]|uniref:Uncharacterized protein n=1 Tax=Galerina marginata (strain CBS 339.88) TaxID=685588 RepID=A0A067SMM1_GALM3|nr:hypothetical protein GALMADRAFT_143983 [Galerina marginata CBS 339.88]
MTEYDYSPDAIERHLAKQAQIADWVERTKYHEPVNPFVPIPGEHTPSEAYNAPTLAYQPTPQYPYQFQQPQPTFYATPQGVISPTYSLSKRHHDRHERHHRSSHHASGSKSLRPSPHTATSALPMSTSQMYPPPIQRSASTPPSMTVLNPNGMIVPIAMTTPQSYFGYPAQQHQFFQPRALVYPSPYLTSPPVNAQTYSGTSSHTNTHSHSYSRSRPSSSRRSSRSVDRSYQPQMNYSVQSPPLLSPPYGQAYQPSSNQSVVVPINGGAGGYVVVPAGQNVQVVPPQSDYSSHQYYRRDYDSDSESDPGGGSSFFSGLSLKGLGRSLKGRSRSSKKRGRRDSH